MRCESWVFDQGVDLEGGLVIFGMIEVVLMLTIRLTGMACEGRFRVFACAVSVSSSTSGSEEWHVVPPFCGTRGIGVCCLGRH